MAIVAKGMGVVMTKKLLHSWEDFVPPLRRCVWCGLLKDKGVPNPNWPSRNPKVPKYFIKYHTMIDDKLVEHSRATFFKCNRKEQS